MQWLLELLYVLMGKRLWEGYGKSMSWIYDTGASWDLEDGILKEKGTVEGGVVGEWCIRSIGPMHIKLEDSVFTLRIGGKHDH